MNRTFDDLIELLRARCMYGDDYAEGKGHTFDPESWAGDCLLISAYHHVTSGVQYYGRSTAEIALANLASANRPLQLDCWITGVSK